MLTLTRQQARRIDQLALEELGIPGIVLMENAGRGAAALVLDAIRGSAGRTPTHASVVVLCGGGNNGGDGYVIARHLHNAGIDVSIVAAKAPAELTGDAAVNARIIQRMGLTIRPVVTEEQLQAAPDAWAQAGVIVDALLGTGFSGAVRAPIRNVIERCNKVRGWHPAAPKVVAIDVPSGLDCDKGTVDAGGVAIRADVTVTFVAPKVGFLMPQAKLFLGRVEVVDIGVPPELVQRIVAGG